MAYISKYNTSAFQKKSPAALKRSIISVKMFRLRRLNFTLEYLFFACVAELSYLKIFCLQHPRLDRFDQRVLHPRVPKTHSGLLPTVGWSSGEELLLPWESQWGGVLVVLLPTPPHSGEDLTTIILDSDQGCRLPHGRRFLILSLIKNAPGTEVFGLFPGPDARYSTS